MECPAQRCNHFPSWTWAEWDGPYQGNYNGLIDNVTISVELAPYLQPNEGFTATPLDGSPFGRIIPIQALQNALKDEPRLRLSVRYLHIKAPAFRFKFDGKGDPWYIDNLYNAHRVLSLWLCHRGAFSFIYRQYHEYISLQRKKLAICDYSCSVPDQAGIINGDAPCLTLGVWLGLICRRSSEEYLFYFLESCGDHKERFTVLQFPGEALLLEFFIERNDEVNTIFSKPGRSRRKALVQMTTVRLG